MTNAVTTTPSRHSTLYDYTHRRVYSITLEIRQHAHTRYFQSFLHYSSQIYTKFYTFNTFNFQSTPRIKYVIVTPTNDKTKSRLRIYVHDAKLYSPGYSPGAAAPGMMSRIP